MMFTAATADRWTKERVQQLREMWANGASASEVARALGGGITRAAVIGKVHREHLQKRTNSVRRVAYAGARPRVVKEEKHGNKGQPKAASIVARRQKSEDARLNGKLSHRGAAPFRAGSIFPEEAEPGVDVTSMIGIAFMEIGTATCKWAVGGSGSGMRFCGDPPVEGSPYCEHHEARAYQRA